MATSRKLFTLDITCKGGFIVSIKLIDVVNIKLLIATASQLVMFVVVQ